MPFLLVFFYSVCDGDGESSSGAGMVEDSFSSASLTTSAGILDGSSIDPLKQYVFWWVSRGACF